MLAALASLAFAAAALAAVAAIRATLSQYRDVALSNIAALRDCANEREFRVTIASASRKPALAGHPGVRRVPHRAQAARAGFRPSRPRRVAA